VHDAEVRGRRAGDRDGRDGDRRLLLDVLADDIAIIHAVELIAAENDEVIVRTLEEIAHVPSDGVGRALVPMSAAGSLLGRQHLHEGPGELVELIGRGDVPDERGAVKLREHVHLPEPRVDAVGNGDIDDAIFAGKRDSGLRPVLCKREETAAGAASHDDCQGPLFDRTKFTRGHRGMGGKP
jgi:hypothetical protein